MTLNVWTDSQSGSNLNGANEELQTTLWQLVHQLYRRKTDISTVFNFSIITTADGQQNVLVWVMKWAFKPCKMSQMGRPLFAEQSNLL